MPDWYSVNETKYEKKDNDTLPKPSFNSRRSPVLCRNGCVSSSQPLASSVGLSVLREKGGNAADAAIATAAALAVLEPCSNGLGGDTFALLYDAETKRLGAVNGSGRSPARLTLDGLRETLGCDGDDDAVELSRRFCTDANAVTVPGAARGWDDIHRKYGSGRLSFADLLEPAARLAEEGFPVAPLTAHTWSSQYHLISRWNPKGAPLSVNGTGVPPRPGDVVRNPDLARVLRSLGARGATDGFYDDLTIGGAIAAAVRRFGGAMTADDLRAHVRSEFPDPVRVRYRDVHLWSVPPNNQAVAGLVALEGLGALEEEEKGCETATLSSRTTAESYHTMIEMMRLGFGDARSFVCDPAFANDVEDGERRRKTGMEWLLDRNRVRERAKKLFRKDKAVIEGVPDPTSCTVSFQVVDGAGNAVSMVVSNYLGFGTGIVPDGCGFTLQNRGFGFNLDDPQHPNALAPNKRPYNTIVPAILTHADNDDGEGGDDLYATLTNMGGFMQPQGILQLTLAMVTGGLNPQEAIDLPRFCIVDGTHDGTVYLEDGVDQTEIEKLVAMGHTMQAGVSGFDRAMFGRAQIIRRDRITGVLWAGSDGRADGCAVGY